MFTPSETRPAAAGAGTAAPGTLRIRQVRPQELEDCVPELSRLLADTVNGGAGLGFVAPVGTARTSDYLYSLLPELRAGSRLLFVATLDDRVVGSGQLWLPQWATAVHRAEVQKLFVDRQARRRRIGAILMATLHDVARSLGRSLLVLHTRHGEPPERFYRGLGYLDVGVLPGGVRGAAGERHDLVTLYQEFAHRSGEEADSTASSRER